MTFKSNWQKVSGADSTEFYRTWRTKLGPRYCCVSDIDQAEYIWVDDKVVPVAIIEIGVATYGPNPAYLEEALRKVAKTRGQGAINLMVATLLDVEFWLVILRNGVLDRFWVHNITNPTTWYEWNEEQYKAWLLRLRSKAREKARGVYGVPV